MPAVGQFCPSDDDDDDDDHMYYKESMNAFKVCVQCVSNLDYCVSFVDRCRRIESLLQRGLDVDYVASEVDYRYICHGFANSRERSISSTSSSEKVHLPLPLPLRKPGKSEAGVS